MKPQPRRWLLYAVSLVLLYGVLVLCGLWGETPRRTPGSLRWGGDRAGGAPFIFDNGGELSGFETEVAGYLAEQLGRRPEFVQGDWDKVLAQLNRGDIDLALNGFEWTPERAREWAATIPYYIYRLQLLARDPDPSSEARPIRGWDDLRRQPGQRRLKVGVLSSSAAQRYLETEFGDDVEVVAYSQGVTSAMRLVEQGQLDATVQDLPTAIYYVQQKHAPGGLAYFPDLRFAGAAAARGYYVIYVRRDDTQLRDRLNQAIRAGIESGALRRIYEAYGLWTADQDRLLETAEQGPLPLADADGGATNWRYDLGLLLRAAWTTVLLSCLAMPLAMLLGLSVAMGRLYGPRWLGWLLGGYVEFLRGTPLLLQLYVLYFLLPEVHITIPAFWAGVLGLAVNYSAYEAENYRAGFLAIPRGQLEAALALGMTPWVALRRVLVAQAVRLVIPPVTNDFISLFKDTSICSVIAVTELTGKFNELYNNHPSEVLRLGVVTAALYLLMSYPLSLVARRLEHRAHRVAA